MGIYFKTYGICKSKFVYKIKYFYIDAAFSRFSVKRSADCIKLLSAIFSIFIKMYIIQNVGAI